MGISTRIQELCDHHKTNFAELERCLGFSNGVIRHWDTASPKVSFLLKICEHFNVSLDYLVRGSSTGVLVPVLGNVQAGVPVQAVENVLGWEELSSNIPNIADYFALRVRGASMEPKLFEGDTVIVRKQSVVDNGQIAVVLIDGEDATLKQIKFDDTGIWIIGFNKEVFKPIHYNSKDILQGRINILGLAVEVRRKLTC